MNNDLRQKMELWLQTNGGTFHTCDEERFYDFVLTAVQTGSQIEQFEYEEVMDSCRAHNANLTESYLERHDFKHFESYCEFCKYVINSSNH